MSFLELIVVMAVAGLLLALAVPRYARWADRVATRRAAAELASFYHRARFAAVFQGGIVRIDFQEDSLRAFLEGEPDSEILGQAGPGANGVWLSASRPVVRIGPTGLGWGAANTKLVVRRGVASDSLTLSRLGRLKRWW